METQESLSNIVLETYEHDRHGIVQSVIANVARLQVQKMVIEQEKKGHPQAALFRGVMVTTTTCNRPRGRTEWRRAPWR